MFYLRRLRTHTKLLIGLTLTLVVMVSWIGFPHYSLMSRATRSDLADTDRSTNSAGESAPRSTSSEPDEATRRRVAERYGQLPLSFEGNRGQTDSQVNFLSRGLGYNLFLTPTEAVMVIHRPSAQPEHTRTPRDSRDVGATRNIAAASTQSVLRMQMVGANPEAQVAGQDQLPGTSNYLIGNNPSEWRTNVPTYGRVLYRDVYAGIDLVYYGNQRELEYDFVVAPGANPDAIRLRFEGAEEMRIDGDGDLCCG